MLPPGPHRTSAEVECLQADLVLLLLVDEVNDRKCWMVAVAEAVMNVGQGMPALARKEEIGCATDHILNGFSSLPSRGQEIDAYADHFIGKLGIEHRPHGQIGRKARIDQGSSIDTDRRKSDRQGSAGHEMIYRQPVVGAIVEDDVLSAFGVEGGHQEWDLAVIQKVKVDELDERSSLRRCVEQTVSRNVRKQSRDC